MVYTWTWKTEKYTDALCTELIKSARGLIAAAMCYAQTSWSYAAAPITVFAAATSNDNVVETGAINFSGIGRHRARVRLRKQL